MTMRRFMWIFVVIGAGSLLMALMGKFLLHWNDGAVGTWTGIGSGYLLGALLMRMMPRWWRDEVDEEYRSRASIQYRRRVIPAMVIYTALLLVVTWALKQPSVSSLPLRALLAVLPSLPILFVFYAFLSYVGQVDELKRRIELEAVGIGTMLVCSLYLPASFLQMAKVIEVPSGVAMMYVFPLMCLGYGIGKFITMRRYR